MTEGNRPISYHFPMKRSLVLLPALLAGMAFAQQPWTKVFSPEGRFQVQMPGDPKMSTQKYEKSGYTIPTTIYILSRPGVNYLIAVSTLPATAPPKLSGDLVQSAKDDFIKSVQGTWLSEKNAAYNGVSGRLMTFKAPNGANGAMWIVAKNKKIFTLTIAKPGKPYAAEQAKFFGSFRLIP